MTGALTGLGLGALAGLGVLSGVIPVVGPAIAAGTLGVILSNAAAGAGIAGLVGALIGAGIPEDEAKYYHGEFEAGRTIVTVTADGRADEATAILRRHGAYDMSTAGDVAADRDRHGRHRRPRPRPPPRRDRQRPRGRAGPRGRHDPGQGGAAPRREAAGRDRRGHASARRSTPRPRHIEVPVQREEVVIERTPSRPGRDRRHLVGDIREGEEIRIPVREEQVNVSKDAVVTEEVKVGKRVVQDTEHVSGQVRKEEVKVEQTGDVDVRTRGGKK